MNPYKQQYKRAFGIFDERDDLEAALGELRKINYPMEQVSVVKQEGGKVSADLGDKARINDRIEEPVDNKADKGAATGAAVGGTLGGITGLLVGLGTLAIPGIGPILLAGAAATALATTLAGTAIGAATGGLLGSLVGLSIPEDKAKLYEQRIYRGDFLVIVEGNAAEIDRAEDILKNHGIQEWEVYDVSDRASTPNPSIARDDRPTLLDRTATTPNPAVLPDDRDSRISSTVSTAGVDRPRVSDRDNLTPVFRDNLIEKDQPTDVGRGTPGYPNENPSVYSTEPSTAVGYGTPVVANVNPVVEQNVSPIIGVYDAPVDAQNNTTNDSSIYRAVSVFSNRSELRTALDALKDANFPREQISVVSKHTDDVTDNKAGEGAAAGAATGGALGGLGGLLVGLGVLALPGIGPVLVGGTLATALATTAAGGAIGAAAGGLTGGLIGLGVPENDAKGYQDRVAAGDYLLVLEGSESQLRQARGILKNTHDWQMYKTNDRELSGDRRNRDSNSPRLVQIFNFTKESKP